MKQNTIRSVYPSGLHSEYWFQPFKDKRCFWIGALLFFCGCSTNAKIKGTDVLYRNPDQPVYDSSSGKGQSSKVVPSWPTPFFITNHTYVEDGFEYILQGRFEYKRFTATEAFTVDHERLLDWDDVEEKCRRDCQEIVVDPHTPLETVFWLGLFYWMDSRDSLDVQTINTLGFGVEIHETQSLVKDFSEEDNSGVEVSGVVGYDNMRFMIAPNVWCSSEAKSYMSDIVGNSKTEQVSTWLSKNGYSVGVNTVAEAFNIARERSSSIEMSHQRTGDGLFLYSLQSQEEYAAGSSEELSQLTGKCQGPIALYAKELMNFQLSYQHHSNLGWHFKFGLR